VVACVVESGELHSSSAAHRTRQRQAQRGISAPSGRTAGGQALRKRAFKIKPTSEKGGALIATTPPFVTTSLELLHQGRDDRGC